jgi:hypothetical protein
LLPICANDIVASRIQFSERIVDDNTISRIFQECLTIPASSLEPKDCQGSFATILGCSRHVRFAISKVQTGSYPDLAARL